MNADPTGGSPRGLQLLSVSPSVVFGPPEIDQIWMGPEQLRAIAFGIEASQVCGAGFLFGPRGCGKTVALESILRGLSNREFFRLSDSWDSAHAVLAALLESIGERADEPQVEVLRDRFHAFLQSQYRDGRRIIIAVDDANKLTQEAAEELARIAFLDLDGWTPLVLFVGRHEAEWLVDTILPDGNPDERLVFRMCAPSHLECSEYILARLTAAGIDESIFPESARLLVARLSRGSLVRTNLLCQGSLLTARRRGEVAVTRRDIRDASLMFFGPRDGGESADSTGISASR